MIECEFSRHIRTNVQDFSILIGIIYFICYFQFTVDAFEKGRHFVQYLKVCANRKETFVIGFFSWMFKYFFQPNIIESGFVGNIFLYTIEGLTKYVGIKKSMSYFSKLKIYVFMRVWQMFTFYGENLTT